MTANAEVPKPQRGRPRKTFEYGAAVPSLSFRNPAQFSAYLAGYPDSSGLLAYIYRLKPKIDLGLIGATENHIHKTMLPEEMTPEYCARRWGAGLFFLTLTDANRPKGRQECARTWIEIDDPALRPIYDPRTLLVHDRENLAEVQRLLAAGVLMRDENGEPKVRTEGAGPSVSVAPAAVPPAAPVAVPELSQSLQEKLLMKILDSPSAQLEQAFQIAGRLMPAPVAAASLPLDLDQLAERVASKLRPPSVSSSVASQLKEFEELDSLFSRIGAGRVAPAADSGSGWAVLAATLERFATPLVPLAAAWLSRGLSGGSAGAPAAVAPVALTGSAVPAAVPVLLPAEAPLLDRIEQVARLGLQKRAAGVAGFHYASWVVGFYPGGREVFRFLEQDAGGVAGVMGMLAMNPDTADFLADPGLESWLQDFFSYDLGESADGSDSEVAA